MIPSVHPIPIRAIEHPSRLLELIIKEQGNIISPAELAELNALCALADRRKK